MVILSVSVVTKKGKILMARQYVPMSRLRIEGLLAAFPKLVFSEDSSSSKQHTFVETDEVRYIYQPMDMLYLLLITNMQSNILEDLSTLRTIAKLIPDYCQGHDESAVEERAFELIFAIDEVVSPLGYREQVNYKQIEDYTKMDSAEAKLTAIIETSKMENAKQMAKDKEKQFDAKRKREMQMHKPGLQSRLSNLTDLSVLGGVRNNGLPLHAGAISSDSVQFNQGNMEETITQHGNSNKYGNQESSSDEDHGNNNSYSNRKSKYAGGSGRKGKKSRKKQSGQRRDGMKLASKNTKDKLLEQQLNADKSGIETHLLKTSLLSGNTGLHSKDEEEDSGPRTPVEINVTEKLTVSLDRDGEIKKFEVKGDLEVIVNQPEAGSCLFEIVKPSKVEGFGKIIYRPHPKMDSSAFKKNVLMLKDEKKSMKMGRNAKTSILKWRMSSGDEDMIPIRLNCWPEADSGEVTVSVTYNVEKEGVELSNVIVTLPAPVKDEPEVNQCDGQYTFYQREHELQWNLGDLATGDEGQFEYVLDDVEVDDLWPVSVHFEMQTTFLQIQVAKVLGRETEEDFEFSTKYLCNADKYVIE